MTKRKPKRKSLHVRSTDANTGRSTMAETLPIQLEGQQAVTVSKRGSRPSRQETRDKKALQAILDRYLRRELATWAKRFPDEFYRQISDRLVKALDKAGLHGTR